MLRAIAIDDEPLALGILETFCEQCTQVTLVQCFTNPSLALEYIQRQAIDLLFLDIEMPNMNGIHFLQQIPPSILVIFTTAYSEYAVQGYELNAIDYLLKPIQYQRFEQAVRKAAAYYQFLHPPQTAQASNSIISVRADASWVQIPIANILYIEGCGDYLKLYILNQKMVVSRMTMKDIAAVLPPNDFLRVHRSYIVPKHRIQLVRNRTIVLPEKEIPIGNTYLETFQKQFMA